MKTVQYAAQVVKYLRDNPGRHSCTTICDDLGLPTRFVLQIMRRLTTVGILNSYRGVKGGYSLSKTFDEATLGDLFTACDASIRVPFRGLQYDIDDIMRRSLSAELHTLQA